MQPDYKTYHDKDVAVLIRAELKQNFPGQKFSVRTESHGSIRVSWIDGPAYRAVEAITSIFTGKSFDGMTDSTNFHKVTYKGELCQFYCYAPDLNRDLSLEFASEVARIVQFDDNYRCVEVDKYNDGTAYFKGLSDDHHNNRSSMMRYLVRSLDANSYSADEINAKLKAIELSFNANSGSLGDRDSQVLLDRTLETLKTYVDTHGLDTEPLVTEMDLSQFNHRWSSDPTPAPSKPTIAIVPDPDPETEPTQPIEPMVYQLQAKASSPQLLWQIEIDYRSSVANHIANGDLENIITYADYRSKYYAEKYEAWVLAAVESGNVRSIVSIDDWICDLMLGKI
jgi:hypothetical protein